MTMSRQNTATSNGRMAAQIEDARDCIADLARHGASILCLEVGAISVPRITVARPPRGLKGGTIKIRGGSGHRIATYAVRHMDCQVEWRVEQ